MYILRTEPRLTSPMDSHAITACSTIKTDKCHKNVELHLLLCAAVPCYVSVGSLGLRHALTDICCYPWFWHASNMKIFHVQVPTMENFLWNWYFLNAFWPKYMLTWHVVCDLWPVTWYNLYKSVLYNFVGNIKLSVSLRCSQSCVVGVGYLTTISRYR